MVIISFSRTLLHEFDYPVGIFVLICWWNLPCYFSLSHLDHDICSTAFFISRLLLKQTKWSVAKGSGADQCRHHVTCPTAPCCGSVHFISLRGWDSFRQDSGVDARSFVVSRSVVVCCGGNNYSSSFFLCGRFTLNVLIARVQFSQLTFVFQDHATTVTSCVVSWLLLWSF